MFFDELPPDTSIYMIAGYAIFFVITLVYLASLFIRTRNLNQDLTTLQSLQAERQEAAKAAAPSKRKASQGGSRQSEAAGQKGCKEKVIAKPLKSLIMKLESLYRGYGDPIATRGFS